jgi:hypothetical protein
MIASIHFADAGAAAPWLVRKRRRPNDVAGLRYATMVGPAIPLGRSRLAAPVLGRVGLIAFWDDETAIERFLTDDKLGRRLASGWHSRVAPVTMHEYHRTRRDGKDGTWPGIDDPWLTDPRSEPGPVLSLTLARTRLLRLPRTLRATLAAAQPLVGDPGLIWGVAVARPPIIATVTLWQSATASDSYLRHAGHHRAVESDRSKALHHSGIFARFAPLASHGQLDGRHPLSVDWLNNTAATPSE